jgi:hypothetical protein
MPDWLRSDLALDCNILRFFSLSTIELLPNLRSAVSVILFNAEHAEERKMAENFFHHFRISAFSALKFKWDRRRSIERCKLFSWRNLRVVKTSAYKISPIRYIKKFMRDKPLVIQKRKTVFSRSVFSLLPINIPQPDKNWSFIFYKNVIYAHPLGTSMKFVH